MLASIYRVEKYLRHWLAGGLLLLLAAGSATGGTWLPIAKDGIHDPKSPAAKQLQQPEDALNGLTPDNTGNQVRWVQSLDKGEIKPREKLRQATEIRKLDQDILLDLKGSMSIVRFPHRAHTEWLDCSNCHDHLFEKRTGATRISMQAILQGEQCGVCHGAVAFPLTECKRCHSVSRPGKSVSPPAGSDPAYHRPTGVAQ
jgi:c(7)-type cytochrome triheme protein